MIIFYPKTPLELLQYVIAYGICCAIVSVISCMITSIIVKKECFIINKIKNVYQKLLQ